MSSASQPTGARRRLIRSAPHGTGWASTFAVFSAHAEHIELCLFDPNGRRRESPGFDLPECTDEVWHGYLPSARIGLIYGYRAHGPYNPQDGHRFNHRKLLLDPYAKTVSPELFAGRTHYSVIAFNSPRGDLSTIAATARKVC